MRKMIYFLLVAFLLTSCSGTASQSTPTQSLADIETMVNQTVIANLTETVSLQPSTTSSATPSETLITEALPSSTDTLVPIVASATVVSYSSGSSSDAANLTDQDPADGTDYLEDETVNVTWTFENIGSTTWTTSYCAKYSSGTSLSDTTKVCFSDDVDVDSSASITVSMTTPSSTGSYKSEWVLRNADDQAFYYFYVIIDVVSEYTQTLTPTITDTPTITYTPTITKTPTITLTPTMTLTPTKTKTPTQAPTAANTATPTSIPTDTPVPTETRTIAPTSSS